MKRFPRTTTVNSESLGYPRDGLWMSIEYRALLGEVYLCNHYSMATYGETKTVLIDRLL